MNPGSVSNIAKIPELNRRILFTFGMLAVYRLGCAVPTPGIDPAEIRRFFEETGGGLFGIINLFIIYLQFRSLPMVLCAFVGIPVAFAGGAIFLALAGVKVNTGVLVGFIALFGIAVDDGVIIATYLNQVFTRIIHR